MMRASLLADRRFAPLFLCQFLSALGDNLLRNAIGVSVLWTAASSAAALVVPVAAIAFVAPSILLSSLAGELADRMDKAKLARRLKFADAVVATAGAAGLAFGSLPLLMLALVGAGVVAALFGPVKYGILPDQLPADRLPAANALVEGATFMAILAGTGAGAVLLRPLGAAGVGLVVVALAIASWLAAAAMPAFAPTAPGLRIRADLPRATLDLLRKLRADRPSWRAALANTWFWMAGGAVLSLTPALVHDVLGGSPAMEGVFACAFALGVAAGSGAASFLSGGRVLPTLAGLGAAAMALALGDLWLHAHAAAPTIPHALTDLFLAAAGAGLLAVPTMAQVQARSPAGARARTIAALNVLSSLGVALGSGLLMLGVAVGLSAPALFGLTGLACLIAAVVMLRWLPANPVGDLLWILFRLLFRARLRGAANLPAAGVPAVVVANHVSWLDAALMLAVMDHQPAFAIDAGVAALWWVRPALRFVRAVPVDPSKPQTMRRLLEAVRSGRSVMIFPEGRITVTGSLMMTQGGAAMLAERAGVPIVPARIEGLERTPFSRLERSQVRRALLPRVTLTVLPPTSLRVPDGLAGRARRAAAIRLLGDVLADMVVRTTRADRTLMQAVHDAGRAVGLGREAVADPLGGALSYRRLLAGANAYGRRFAPLAPVGGRVGVMLPNANATLVSLLGLSSAGLVPVMLNPRAGIAAIDAARRATCFGQVITARALIDRLKLQDLVARLSEAGVTFVYLDDVRLGAFDRLRALARRGRPLAARSPDDEAVVLMTSGSSGTPKAVVHSHRGLLTNVAQLGAVVDFGRRDRVLNAMPLFHAFGLSSATLLPLAAGARVFLYPNPLDYQGVPIAAYGLNATVMFMTQVFAEGYLRRAHPQAFRSVRLAVGGASKFKDSTLAAWNETFGLRILVGYGLTETAPVIAFNTPTSNRFGTAGRVLPGIETRTVPVDGIDADGVLQVRGGNVMLGYLTADRPGELQSPPDGWFDTGDVVSFDADGHLRILDRLGRFAKLGGEKVSLDGVEQLAAGAWPGAAVVAVAVPDPRKDERIVLLTDRAGATRPDFLAHARAAGAPELSFPAEVRVIDHIPMLGSGKPDLAEAKRLATV